MKNDWREFIVVKKQEYYKISVIKCPALNNEEVHFTHDGFNHMLRKKSELRDREERARRLNLLQFAPRILSSSPKFATRSANPLEESEVVFWSFVKIIHGRRMIVIVRQVGNGKKHFFSIFDEPL